MVLIFWFFHKLNLSTIFGIVILEYLLAVRVIFRSFSYKASDETERNDRDFLIVLRKYRQYCLPLLPYAAIGFLAQFVDTWILQTFGGSVEQAYYAIGAQFSAIALIATTSILSIFWKEIAEANYEGNFKRVWAIYRKVSRSLFLLGAVIAGFLVPWSADLIKLILGESYVKGTLTLSIMFLYPIHQALGQINGSLLLATERVSTQVIVGIISMLVGMVVTYFVLAPSSELIPGLGWGADGLALKMVVIQCVVVNIMMYIIAKIWDWPFEWAYQLGGLVVCLGLGWGTHAFVVHLLSNSCSVVLMMIITGVLFTGSIIMLLMTIPWLIGFKKNEISEILIKINNYLFRPKPSSFSAL
jgi:O-antigen/teichoic acid export membrane protein